MVTIQQVQSGLCRYVDSEIVSKMTGWQRWVVGAGAAAFAENLPNTLQELRQNPVVSMLGVIDDQGNIDIDKLHRYFSEQAAKGPVTITVPFIGPVTLSSLDVDRLAAMIKG